MPLSTEPTPARNEDDCARPKAKRDPDAEAIAIAMRFAERLEVAQSLFRLVTNLAQQHAAVVAVQAEKRVRSSAMAKIAQAATQAAIHAATKAVARHVDGEAPATAGDQATTEHDHETLHDDAC